MRCGLLLLHADNKVTSWHVDVHFVQVGKMRSALMNVHFGHFISIDPTLLFSTSFQLGFLNIVSIFLNDISKYLLTCCTDFRQLSKI